MKTNSAPQLPADPLDDVQSVDRHRLQRALDRCRGGAVPASLQARIDKSAAVTAARRDAAQGIELAENLPVSARADEIAAAVAAHPVVVVCGETGSGKTTQLPKILMRAGFGARGMIGHTQPRRLAARSVGQRIADEIGTSLGARVGVQTRFDKRVGAQTQIKLMTDGILLAETARDRFLNRYQAIIVDEAHERTLNVDFLLGYLKRLRSRRPDLKVVVTSATIDPARFAAFFDDAPVIDVAGRGYPVSVRYRPPEGDAGTAAAVEATARELWREGPGDILVFLPGERDIRDCERHLQRALAGDGRGAEIVPLYARLTRGAQNRIFAPSAGRRIVLATNVAETSLTVPGIRYVIDTGLARISRYSTTAKVQQLPIEPVSQASLKQRAGRCGRLAPGICIRLFDAADHDRRPAFTDPEIRRTNLASVLLSMADLRLGAIERFPFIDQPERRHVNDGRNLLRQLQAMSDGHITELGRRLARLPLDPRIGRMLLAGAAHGVGAALRVLAAGLTVQDPRERPAGEREAADAAQRVFADARSDFVARLKLWDAYQAAARELSNRRLRRWCREHFINAARMCEWQDLARQLRGFMREAGDNAPRVAGRLAETDYATLHKALLTGLLDHVGQVHEKGGYRGARGRRFHIFPGSGVAAKPPKWLVAAELIETSRLFAHVVAGVDPKWIEQAGAHLVSRERYAPHWARRRGQVVARERVKLFGLTLADGRKIDYAPIDNALARDIFIRDALVAFDMVDQRGRTPGFLKHNRAAIARIAEREDRFRRRDLLVDETAQQRFYDQRLGASVCDRRSLQHWLKHHDEHVLYFDEHTLSRRAGGELTEADFPRSLRFDALEIPLDYAFEPGSERDGVTAQVPLAALEQISRERAAWLVPGLLEEKYREYLKALPKKLRRAVVPVPDFARAAAERVEFGRGDPVAALRASIAAMTGVDIPIDAWADFTPSPHLRMRFEIVDDAGKSIAAGRDLDRLRQDLGDAAQAAIGAAVDASTTQTGLTRWPDHDLAARVELRHAGVRVDAVPALVDRGTHVDLEALSDADAAQRAHRFGVIRLLRLALVRPSRSVKRDLARLGQYAVAPLAEPPPAAFVDDDLLAFIGRDPEAALLADLLHALIGSRITPAPRSRAGFDAAVADCRRHLMADAVALWDELAPALARWSALRKHLRGGVALDWMPAIDDINAQLAHLVHVGFVSSAARKPSAARALARYLAAIEQRLDKLARDGAGPDRERMQRVAPYWQAYLERAERAHRRGRRPQALVDLRWMIEEYRVQVFAQPLGTAFKVSAKRLDAALAEC